MLDIDSSKSTKINDVNFAFCSSCNSFMVELHTHTYTQHTTTGTQIYKDIQDRNYSKIIQNEVK